jgi:hypothetical protein
MVASSATMKLMTERLIMINHSFFSGFHSSGFSTAFSRSILEDEAEGEDFGVSAILVDSIEDTGLADRSANANVTDEAGLIM